MKVAELFSLSKKSPRKILSNIFFSETETDGAHLLSGNGLHFALFPAINIF